MPFKSKAQQRFMFANRKQLAKQGVDVDEWAKETDFKRIPERVKKASFPATEYFKLAELSLAAKDRLLELGGTLGGGVLGGLAGSAGLHAFDVAPNAVEQGLATGAGTLLGSNAGKTLALHAWGHRAPTTVGEAVLGLPDPITEKQYEKLPPTALAAKVAKVMPSDLKHGTEPDSKFDPAELARGVEIEKEHTNDPAVAKAITKAHLHEIKDYNTRLDRMEEQAKKTAFWATEYFSR